jgi:hypothetical protein
MVRAVGAPVAAKLKFVKVVSACAVRAGLNAKAPTALPSKSLRRMFIAFIMHLPFRRNDTFRSDGGVRNDVALLAFEAINDATLMLRPAGIGSMWLLSWVASLGYYCRRLATMTRNRVAN